MHAVLQYAQQNPVQLHHSHASTAMGFYLLTNRFLDLWPLTFVFTGHPRFFNQLSSGLDLIGLAGEWLTSTANSNM